MIGFKPGNLPHHRFCGLCGDRRSGRWDVVHLEYERHSQYDLGGDDHQCPDHDHSGRDWHSDRSNPGGWIDADFGPVPLHLVWGPLAAGFGLIFIVIVMFLPYGIVGTWRLRKANMKEGWKRLLGLFKTKKKT